MQMKKKFKEERASMAVYVTVVLIGFLLILSGIYFSSISVRKSQLTTVTIIKQSYEKNMDDIETIYQTQLAKLIPSATVTVTSTATLTGVGVTATITQEKASDLDLTNCKYVYNNSQEAIGTDASNYTDGTLTSASDTLTLSKSTEGTYYLHVLTTNKYGYAVETISAGIEVISSSAITYASANTTSDPYSTFTAPADGTYKLQVWGAQGGYYNASYGTGGLGGYSTGTITLAKGDTLYVYVGQQGGITTATGNSVVTNGYNGGGGASYYGGTGGGATDIRFTSGTWNDESSLLSRVIVAGGGGGAQGRNSTSYKANGGYGGGTSGGAGTYYNGNTRTTYTGKGATQTAGGAAGTYSSYPATAGSFGQGGTAGRYSSTTYRGSGGGGGGWYGGGRRCL